MAMVDPVRAVHRHFPVSALSLVCYSEQDKGLPLSALVPESVRAQALAQTGESVSMKQAVALDLKAHETAGVAVHVMQIDPWEALHAAVACYAQEVSCAVGVRRTDLVEVRCVTCA